VCRAGSPAPGRARGQDLQAVSARLDQADRLRAEQPERARAVYRAVVELYEDEAWAAEAVRRASRALGELDSSSARGSRSVNTPGETNP